MAAARQGELSRTVRAATVHTGPVIPDDEPAPDVTITEAPDPGDLRDLETRLDASRPAHLPQNRRPLAAFVREDGALVGGVAGYTQYGWFSVDQLWVADDRRGTGLGSRLLAAAEAEARRRGCHSVRLDTYSFQARPFYEALGYVLFGELDHYPDEHRKYFLAKRLDPDLGPLGTTTP